MSYLPCRAPSCGALVTRADKGYCPAHKAMGSRWAHVDKSYSAQHYGYAWRKLRKKVIARDKGMCQECRRKGIYNPGRDVDHIIDKADGGTDDMDNLQLLCVPHHTAKTAAAGAARSAQVGVIEG